jgi:hypothetical protein
VWRSILGGYVTSPKTKVTPSNRHQKPIDLSEIDPRRIPDTAVEVYTNLTTRKKEIVGFHLILKSKTEKDNVKQKKTVKSEISK